MQKENGKIEIFTPFITKNGVRIYHPAGKLFHFFVDADKSERK